MSLTPLPTLDQLAADPAQGRPEVLRRVTLFRHQLEAWTGSGAPLLVLPNAPAPRSGACLSCGEPFPEGNWRCAPCREAAWIVTEALLTTVVCGGCGQSLLRAGATKGEDGVLRCPGCLYARALEQMQHPVRVSPALPRRDGRSE